ncbi:MAG: hypothetical protein ACXAC0_07365 [Candidatus Thorarchaeota archaeon]|jgi:hypothetical protein
MDIDIEDQKKFTPEALRIIEEANKQGIILRLMGAIAIRLHSPDHAYLHEKLGRFITDIDFVAYEKQTSKIEKFFESQNYSRRMLSFSFALGGRMIFTNNSDQRHIDVFLDRLEMCHKIEYKKRLEIDNPTVPLAELLLQKMQIVKISEKDIIDTTMLFLAHELGDTDEDTINAKHISQILSKEWGFYYTVTTNLNKVATLMRDFDVLDEKDKEVVSSRIDELISRLEAEPKSRSWKMRARVGTSKKWYKDVDTPGG